MKVRSEKEVSLEKLMTEKLSHVRLFVTPWAAAHQAPLSMGFSRQDYWSGVPLPSPNGLVCSLGRNLLLFIKVNTMPVESRYHNMETGETVHSLKNFKKSHKR